MYWSITHPAKCSILRRKIVTEEDSEATMSVLHIAKADQSKNEAVERGDSQIHVP
jgi:hypothetical protein